MLSAQWRLFLGMTLISLLASFNCYQHSGYRRSVDTSAQWLPSLCWHISTVANIALSTHQHSGYRRSVDTLTLNTVATVALSTHHSGYRRSVDTSAQWLPSLCWHISTVATVGLLTHQHSGYRRSVDTSAQWLPSLCRHISIVYSMLYVCMVFHCKMINQEDLKKIKVIKFLLTHLCVFYLYI